MLRRIALQPLLPFATLRRTLAFSAALLSLLVSNSHAQPRTQKKNSPVEITQVDWGWRGVMPADHFAPVRVWLRSTDTSFAGQLAIEYKQDGTQPARYSVPFATTPGVAVPFELAACLPPFCEKIKITAQDANGDGQVVEFSSTGSPEENSLPTVDTTRSTMVIMGCESSKIAFKNLTQIKPAADGAAPNSDLVGPPPIPVPPAPGRVGVLTVSESPVTIDAIWEGAAPATLLPAEAPRQWMAYESAAVVIADLDSLSALEPRALAALCTWVRSGGRLVILAYTAGPRWTAVFTDLPLPLSLDDQTRMTPHPELRTLASGAAEPAYQLPARGIALTNSGRVEGWTTLWPTETPNRSLLAYGPCGLGMVAVLGCDPQRLPRTLSDDPTRELWRTAINTVAPMSAITSPESQFYYNYGRSRVSLGRSSAVALTTALDAVAGAPPLGYGAFVLIGGALALLAGLIGPFDGLVLRRRLGSRTFVTAIGWIGAAAGAAMVGPTLMRSGETYLRRVLLTDTICNEQGTPLLCASTGVTGVFGGKPANPAIEGAAPGSWWRGVAAVNMYSGAGRTFSALNTPIRTARDSDSLREAIPVQVSQGQWTFRTVMNDDPALPDTSQIGARVRRADDGKFSVRLLNVPPKAFIEHAEILVGTTWYALNFPEGPTDPTREGLTGEAMTEPRQISAQSEPFWDGSRTTKIAAQLSRDFVGARERTASLDRRALEGAQVCVTLQTPASTVSLSGLTNVNTAVTHHVRIATPITGSPTP